MAGLTGEHPIHRFGTGAPGVETALGRLLDASVEIHEYTPTMMHNKMLILDGELVSVGSTNFDMRSFDLNDEAASTCIRGNSARA